MAYRILWAFAASGVALHLLGLGWDAYLHAQDSTLAAREGIFTLSNPSHLLIIAGLAVTASAILLMGIRWVDEHALGGDLLVARVCRASMLPLFGAAAAGSVWLGSIAEGQSADAHAQLHSAGPRADVVVLATDPGAAAVSGSADDGHGHTTADPSTTVATTSTEAGTTSAEAMTGSSAHFHSPEVKISPEQLVAAAKFYEDVKITTAKYEDIGVALNEGWIQVTQDLPGIAAHFLKASNNVDGRLLDPEKPETLLYTKRLDGNWRLVGVMFSSETVTDEPPSVFGALDAWHRHENLCFTARAMVRITASAQACRAIPGVFLKTTPWEMHVWTAPGGSGVFSHDFAPINPGEFPPATIPAIQDHLLRQP